MEYKQPPDITPKILSWEQKDTNNRVIALKDALLDARLQIQGLQMWVSRLLNHTHDANGKLTIGLTIQDQVPPPKKDPLA